MNIQILSVASIPALHNNAENTIAPLCELSNKVKTYVKYPSIFSNKDKVTTLYNLYTKADDVYYEITNDVASRLIDISDWLYTQAIAQNITSSRTECQQQLTAQFTGNTTIKSVGEMVTNETIWLPSFIEGTYTFEGNDYYFKIWYSNAHIDYEYPYRELAVVPPIPIKEIDFLLENNYLKVKERLDEETPIIIHDRVMEKTNQAEFPYTELVVRMFKLYDLINKPSSNDTYWRFPVWGNTYDIDDDINDAIIDEIMNNTTHPREEWEDALPEVFNPKEFYIIPHWESFGITNATDLSSTLSPIGDIESELVLPAKYLNWISEENIKKSAQTLPMIYKSALLCFVAKPNNFGGLLKIKEVYSDYQLIYSSDSQFGGMSIPTCEFIKQMTELLEAGSLITPYSLPPAGMNRKEHHDALWITKRIGDIKFHLLSRYQFVKDGIIDE